MDFIAGIDGGGTKTKIICSDLFGNEISKRVFGSFNINSIGAEAFEVLLHDILNYFDSLGRCQGVCIGAAGSSNKLMNDFIEKAMTNGGISNWKVVGDQEIALYGALNGEKGMVIIAGTGSICYGQDQTGGEARSGGWGHLIGDQGSAYAIGQQALNAVCKQWDGYGERTIISDKLAREIGLSSRRKIISYVYESDKSAVADLAQIVEQAGMEEDKVAKRIIQKNAQDLKDLVVAVYCKLNFETANLAMRGGMLEHDTIFRKVFVNVMQMEHPEINCVLPQNEACKGAVMMAQKMMLQ